MGCYMICLKNTILILLFFISNGSLFSQEKIRQPVDPVGFATKPGQMDSIMTRIYRYGEDKIDQALLNAGIKKNSSWKIAICPHDDYTYVGWLYPAVLRNIKANTVIIFGVAHKAKSFGLENEIIFDDFDYWNEPYGKVKVSDLRENIMKYMPKKDFKVHDTLQTVEHSVEAIIPFLQYFNRGVEIISILVPYMPFEKMDAISHSLAFAIEMAMQDKNMEWKRDVAMVISTDAVHYGDEDWGGQNYAEFGCDSSGYRKAVDYEEEIIRNCLTGQINKEKQEKFTQYTVQKEDYKSYKWTWCGRYSVPFGLLTAIHLLELLHGDPLRGMLIGYRNSLATPKIPVNDLGMGTTAVANMHHWVGYTAIGYK